MKRVMGGLFLLKDSSSIERYETKPYRQRMILSC